MKELIIYCVVLIILAVVCSWINKANNDECTTKGGKIIERFSELFDTCLLSNKEKK